MECFIRRLGEVKPDGQRGDLNAKIVARRQGGIGDESVSGGDVEFDVLSYYFVAALEKETFLVDRRLCLRIGLLVAGGVLLDAVGALEEALSQASAWAGSFWFVDGALTVAGAPRDLFFSDLI